MSYFTPIYDGDSSVIGDPTYAVLNRGNVYNNPRLAQAVNMAANTEVPLTLKKLHLSRAKLKASSRTSALLSGFAMVAMVEVQLSDEIPQGLLIAFAVCTTLLVAIHMLALMISTCILPNIEAVASLHGMTMIQDSPHNTMHWYIETAWAFSTVLGILLFLLEIAILCWVKFYQFSKAAAWTSTVLLIPIMILFMVFAMHFYRKLVAHISDKAEDSCKKLEDEMKELEGKEDAATGPNGHTSLLKSPVHIV